MVAQSSYCMCNKIDLSKKPLIRVYFLERLWEKMAQNNKYQRKNWKPISPQPDMFIRGVIDPCHGEGVLANLWGCSWLRMFCLQLCPILSITHNKYMGLISLHAYQYLVSCYQKHAVSAKHLHALLAEFRPMN